MSFCEIAPFLEEMLMDKNYVYSFGPNECAGDGSQKYLLGGKGANLADMVKLGLPEIGRAHV